MALEMK